MEYSSHYFINSRLECSHPHWRGIGDFRPTAWVIYTSIIDPTAHFSIRDKWTEPTMCGCFGIYGDRPT